MENKRVLVIEDEEASRYLCEMLLIKDGYDVTTAETTKVADQLMQQNQFDLILLDINLPGQNGIEWVQQFNNKPPVQILMMSVRREPEERVAGFDAGAADYLTKPFHPDELLHRVRKLLQSSSYEVQYCFGAYTLDFGKRSLSKLGDDGEVAIKLTNGEFNILVELARAEGYVVLRDVLLSVIARGGRDPHPKSINVLISRLRHKIEDNPKKPKLVITVPEVGYRLGN